MSSIIAFIARLSPSRFLFPATLVSHQGVVLLLASLLVVGCGDGGSGGPSAPAAVAGGVPTASSGNTQTAPANTTPTSSSNTSAATGGSSATPTTPGTTTPSAVAPSSNPPSAGTTSVAPTPQQQTTAPAVVTVSLVSDRTLINSGEAITLKWQSTNAATCIASGAWSGSVGTNGSRAISGITSTRDFHLSCTSLMGGGAATKVNVRVQTDTAVKIEFVATPTKVKASS